MHCSALFYEHNAHIHLILITVWGGFYYYVHFANEEIDTEKLSNLSKIKQLKSGGAGIHTQAIELVLLNVAYYIALWIFCHLGLHLESNFAA